MKELFPEPAKAPEKSDTLALIAAIKSLQQDPFTVLQQAKELFGPAAGSGHTSSGNDEIDRLDRVLGFAQKLAGLRVGGPGDRTGWDIGLDYARELGTPLLQLLGNWMMLRGGVAPGAIPRVPQPAAPAAFDPYANPQAMREHARAMNNDPLSAPGAPAGVNPGPPVNPAAPATPPNSAPSASENQILPLLSSYGNLVVGALNNGTDGCDFATHLSQLFGNSLHAMISASGEDQLVQSMLAFEQLAIFGEARLRKFAHEFVHFEEILASEEERPQATEGAAA